MADFFERENMHVEGKKRNTILDFLRILATIEIFLMHLTLFLPEVAGNTVFQIMSKISSRGGNAVAILFCLSGYLIWREVTDESLDVGRYYRKRLLRIVPVYYVVLILYVLAGLLPLDWNISRYFLFLNAVIPSDNYALYNNMGAFWTMGSFMLWYLITPWLAKKVKNLKSALYFMAGAFVIGQLAQELLAIVYRWANADAVEFMASNNPIGNIWFFASGVVAYYTIKEKKILQSIFVCMLGITFFTVINSPWYPYWMLLTMIFLMLSEEIAIELPLGLRKITAFCSNISFDFYLVHLGVIYMLERMEICETYGSLAMVLSASVLTGIIAILVYYFDKEVIQKCLKNCGKAKNR